MLIVPAVSVRLASHSTRGPDFALSSVARPAPTPADQPHTTWLPPERIVVEPEVVPYRPIPSPTPSPTPSPSSSPTASPIAASPTSPTRSPVAVAGPAGPGPTPGFALGPPPTTALAATTTTSEPSTTTTAPTTGPATTTTVPVLGGLPAALTPLLPASKGTPTPADRGPASWFHAPDGTCAHRTIPRGTVVTVTRVSTGATTTCVVDDWGPADTSRVIDLSLDTFENLASPDAGVIDVTLSW